MADSISERVARQREEDETQRIASSGDGSGSEERHIPEESTSYEQASYQGAPPPQWQQTQQPQWQQPQWQQPQWQQPYPPQPAYQGQYGPPQWQGQPQQHYGGQQQSGGFDMEEFTRRHIRTPETKEFFKTSEFGAWVLGVAAVLVASAIDNGFDAFEAWMLASALTIGYILSRGLAKAGARRDYPRGRGSADR